MVVQNPFSTFSDKPVKSLKKLNKNFHRVLQGDTRPGRVEIFSLCQEGSVKGGGSEEDKKKRDSRIQRIGNM